MDDWKPDEDLYQFSSQQREMAGSKGIGCLYEETQSGCLEKCEELVQKWTNVAIEMLDAFENKEFMVALAKSLTDRRV